MKFDTGEFYYNFFTYSKLNNNSSTLHVFLRAEQTGWENSRLPMLSWLLWLPTQNCQKDKNCYTMCTFPNLFTIHNTAEIQDQNTKKLCNLNFVGIFHPCDWLIWSHSPSENVSQTDNKYGGCGRMHGWVHCGNYMTQQFVNAITRIMKTYLDQTERRQQESGQHCNAELHTVHQTSLQWYMTWEPDWCRPLGADGNELHGSTKGW
jgi:hypothetical protein